MALVLDGFFALGLAVALLWVWSLRQSMAQDREQADKAQERAECEAKLNRKGERLRCLNCEKKFRGPLLLTGCPQCHLAAFVVPESDAPEKSKG